MNSPHFEHVEWITKKSIAYIYNLEKFKDDWDLFLRGKYSQLSPVLKERIKCYYGENSYEWDYVKSFLYPERYFEKYAELLFDEKDRATGEEYLRSVGELCQPYDKEHEVLNFVELNLVE
jgi:hypothetical protein